MGKGDKRRPTVVTEHEFGEAWTRTFERGVPCAWCKGTGITHTGYEEGNSGNVPVEVECGACEGSGELKSRRVEVRTIEVLGVVCSRCDGWGCRWCK